MKTSNLSAAKVGEKTLFIVGATASGKSDLAIRLAKVLGGEIICADSRTVYTGMDIGTAKPTIADRANAVHYLLDVVYPNQPYTVHQFQIDAKEKIKDISSRNRLPIICGGSGLYVDSVLFDYNFPETAEQIMDMSVVRMQEIIQVRGLDKPNNWNNPRHLKRVIETGVVANDLKKILDGTIIVGIRPKPEVLAKNIELRVENMFLSGLEAEVTELAKVYGWQLKALDGIGYKEIRQFSEGTVTESEAKKLIALRTRQFAKRQTTWFKRNPNIVWFESSDEAFDYICRTFLVQFK